ADGRDGDTLVVALVDELRDVARTDRGMHARQRERGREIEVRHACARVRRAKHGGVHHPGKREIGGVDRLPGRALATVDARRRLPDDAAGPGRPLLERVLLDDDPHLLVAAFDLLLGPNQSRHVRIASSILGYAPQRQMLPAIACLISSLDGSGVLDTSATALTIWPGVQKPHCRASVRTKASTSGWSRSPSIVVTSEPSTVCTSVMHERTGVPSTSTVHAPQ